MCGITGYITKNPTDKTVQAFKALLLANEERGGQSAGIYTSANNLITKKALNPYDFIETLDNETMVKSNLVLGHTRLATTGAVKDNNAHPFRYGQVVGVHNGIVNNYRDILPTARVDSEVIFYELDKNKNNFKKSLKKLQGSFAIAWTYGDDKLYLVRNSNPLAIAYVDGGLFFNSELNILTAILYATYGKQVIAESLPEDTVFVVDSKLETKSIAVEFKHNPYSASTYGLYDYPNGYGYNYSTSKEDDKSVDMYNDDYNVICDKCGLLDSDHLCYANAIGTVVYCHKCFSQLPVKQKEDFSPLYDFDDELPIPTIGKGKKSKRNKGKHKQTHADYMLM